MTLPTEILHVILKYLDSDLCNIALISNNFEQIVNDVKYDLVKEFIDNHTHFKIVAERHCENKYDFINYEVYLLIKYKYQSLLSGYDEYIELFRLSAKDGDSEMLKFLLNLYDYNVADELDNYFDMVLRLSILYNRLSVLKTITTHPTIDIILNFNNNELIEVSIGYGRLEILEYLLSFDYVKNSISKKDWCQYAINAAKSNRLKIIKFIVEKKLIKPGEVFNDMLANAVVVGNLDIVKYLVNLPKKYKVNPTCCNNIILGVAVEHGHLDILKYFVSLSQYNINPAANNNELVSVAAQFNRLEILKYLVSLPKKYNIKVSDRCNEPIKWAIEKNNQEIIDYLLSLPEEYKVNSQESLIPTVFSFLYFVAIILIPVIYALYY